MQKFSFYLLISIFGFVTILSSCKEDEPIEPKDEFVFKGTSYELAKGFVEDFGQVADTAGRVYYNFDLSMVTSSISYDSVNEEFTGTGDIIYLELNTSNDSRLTNGTYTFDIGGGASTITTAQIGINVDVQNPFAGGSIHFVDSGTVSVNIENGIYTVVFNLKVGNDAITGQYTGTMTVID